jgi:hypothetical protein
MSMSALLVSTVGNAADVRTRNCNALIVVEAIRTGGKKLRRQVEHIRDKLRYGDDSAKKLAGELKKQLPAVLWSGTFTKRANDALVQHSGLLCADLDKLGDSLADMREKLKRSPYLWALFISPSGDGLKAVFCVPPDVERHLGSYRAIEQHVRELTGMQIDQACKDVARLCFLSYDPGLYHNPNAIEIEPLPEPEKPQRAQYNGDYPPGLSLRECVAYELLGTLTWSAEKGGYFCPCPGESLHTTLTEDKHTIVYLDGAPTIKCQHNSCSKIVETFNAQLRSLIAKAEYHVRTDTPMRVEVQSKGDVERVESLPVRKSAATRLVEFASAFEFFHDPQDRPFVRLEINGHMEVWPVESTKFRKLLAQMFYKRTRKTINRNGLADAIAALAGRACHDSPEERVFLRVAPHGENILIDLCDAQWRVVEVTPNDWQVLGKSPVAFVRTGSMQSLPEPVRGGSIDPLWDLLNVTPDQRPLVAGSLLNAFHAHGPYFVTNYVGEQGTAKTCAARIERQLVDPNENPLRSPPKEERDLLAQAASNRIVALDNLSSLPSWLSDALCRLATGGGHSARTLYTDLEEISLAVKRPVILNGIEDVATRPDLAERVLQIELETIPDQNRISEKELWRKFDKQRPVIFSGLLDALVCALRELPSITLDSLPRMADAALWATAGETAFGWRSGTFMQAYKRNLDEGAIASVEAHPVGVAIRQLLEKDNQWSGTPAKLLEALNALVSEEQRRTRNWPSNPRALGHSLRRLAPALRRAGIDYQRPPREAGRRIIQLCRVADKTSQTSSSSCAAQENDVCDDPDDLSPSLHVSNKVAGESEKKPMVL